MGASVPVSPTNESSKTQLHMALDSENEYEKLRLDKTADSMLQAYDALHGIKQSDLV